MWVLWDGSYCGTSTFLDTTRLVIATTVYLHYHCLMENNVKLVYSIPSKMKEVINAVLFIK